MKSRLVPFEIAHAEAMTFRAGTQPKEKVLQGIARAIILDAWTLIVDDEIVGSGGICEVREGVGEVWLLLTDRFDGLNLTAIKHIAIRLYAYLELYHRVQAIVFDGDARAIRFIEWLGFNCEGVMRQYVKGADCRMYAMIGD